MQNLFKQRLLIHQRQLQKYLRYILNDSFVVIVTFLFGGVVVYYTNFLKQLPQPYLLGTIVSWLVLFFALMLGKFTSLLKPADQVFLLPKEGQMNQYLKAALLYSMIVPVILLGFVLAFLMPLLQISQGLAFSEYPWLLLLLISLKVSHLVVQKAQLYQRSPKQNQLAFIFWVALSLISLALALFFQPMMGLMIAMLGCLGVVYLFEFRQKQAIDWEKMIAFEQQRLHRLYQFINLFTDVPFIQSKMKRRRYMDFLFNRIAKTQAKTYLHLYLRRFLRSDEFSGQILRLVLVGMICLASLNDWRIALALSLLFIYLIAFQLLPLASQYQYMVLTRLYPITLKQQQANFLTCYRWIVLISAFCLGIWHFLHVSLLLASLLLGIDLLFAALLIWVYAPNRLKKLPQFQ